MSARQIGKTRWIWILFFLFPALAPPASAQADLPALEEFRARKSAEAERLRAATEARASRLGLPLRQELEDGTVILLVGFGPGGRPLYHTNENLNAARTVSADKTWPGGLLGLDLTGAGQELGIWDTGSVRATHQELAGRVVNTEGAPISNHSTLVAGTMIAAGVNAIARGMSYEGTLKSWSSFNDTLEMATEQMEVDPIKVSNHSYGFIGGWRFGSFGCAGDPQWYWFGDAHVSTEEDYFFSYYETIAAEVDQITYDSPGYLPVKSAGNDRDETGPSAGTPHCHWDSSAGDSLVELRHVGHDGDWVPSTDFHPPDGGDDGWDTISGGLGSAKNILTVGAIHDIPGGYTQPSDVVMSTFSGWGPTDDGRIKPDLVANGISLTSSSSSSDTSYASASGTSLSAPNTSGSLGLLHQHAQDLFGVPLLAATMKALALHTADEAGVNPGPDYSFGWGLLNVAAAADVLTAHATAQGPTFHLREDVLTDGGTLELDITANGANPLCATIVWTDPPGAVPPVEVDPPDLVLVNDLDLRIQGPDDTIYRPWVLDPTSPASPPTTGDNFRDSVEQVWIAAPVAGAYSITISHKGTLANGLDQGVSLVVTGNRKLEIFSDGFESGNFSAWSAVVP